MPGSHTGPWLLVGVKCWAALVENGFPFYPDPCVPHLELELPQDLCYARRRSTLKEKVLGVGVWNVGLETWLPSIL